MGLNPDWDSNVPYVKVYTHEEMTMPCKFNIYTDENLVSILWDRAPSIHEWYQVLQLVLAHADYRQGMRLITFTDGKWEPASSEHVREVLAVLESQAARMNPTSLAVVAPAACDFGMARMMETLSEQTQIVVRAFTCRSEAIEWLKDPVRYQPHPASPVA